MPTHCFFKLLPYLLPSTATWAVLYLGMHTELLWGAFIRSEGGGGGVGEGLWLGWFSGIFD